MKSLKYLTHSKGRKIRKIKWKNFLKYIEMMTDLSQIA